MSDRNQGQKEGNRLILCIWDNGPGIPEQILAQIRERRVPDNTGIGLLNIEDRIQMLGGTGSGLKIYSKKGREHGLRCVSASQEVKAVEIPGTDCRR